MNLFNGFGLLSLPLAITFFAACGSKSNSNNPASGNGASSCRISADMCIDLYSSELTQQYKETCPQAGGTFSLNTSCASAGKVTGCEVNSNGSKTHTMWYYGRQAQLANVGCVEAGNEDPNYTSKVVSP